MSDRVRIQMKGGVADVRLNRPDKLNAIDAAMFAGLVEAGEQLAADPSLRTVVLSGEGRAFCAGLDMASFQAMAGDAPRRDAAASPREGAETGGAFVPGGGPVGNRGQRAAWIWQELPVPVIAAVHGVAFGGGLQIALGADIRIVAPDARLSVMEIKWGLVPDMAGTQTLRHLLPLDVAKELAFTGREVSGEEAVALGLATHVSDTPLEAALELAREIAGKSPDAVRASKRLFNETRYTSVAEGLSLEEALQKGLIGSGNQIEAVKANMQKRPPEFSDPE